MGGLNVKYFQLDNEIFFCFCCCYFSPTICQFNIIRHILTLKRGHIYEYGIKVNIMRLNINTHKCSDISCFHKCRLQHIQSQKNNTLLIDILLLGAHCTVSKLWFFESLHVLFNKKERAWI